MKINKYFTNGKYELMFNTNTGVEILQGVNGKNDPFWLDLPSLLDIGIMGHCKNKCPFCYQGRTSEPNMKLENFKRIIDQVKHHTNQVALGGRGDPNKHENFKEIVDYARDNGVVPNYTTSGIDLTDEEVEISRTCGAVAVSDYDKKFTYESLNKFMEAGIKTNIHLIFGAHTFEKCIAILHGYNPWKGLIDIEKLNGVIFLLFKPCGAGEQLKELVPNSYQMKVFVSLIFKPKTTFKIGMDSCLVNHVTKNKKLSAYEEMTMSTCEAARMSAYITPNMHMMPCSFADRSKFSVPIVKSIKNVWERSTVFRCFRKSLNSNPHQCPLGV